MLTSNYLIINRKPQKFDTIRFTGKAAVFINGEDKPLDYGVLRLDESVYAALYCDEARNVTLVVSTQGRRLVETILWYTEDGYRKGLQTLKDALGMHFSPQNLRINRYAEAIAAKLDDGVRLKVTDAVDEDGMVKCPECGMLNPAGSDYCLDCGAEIN